MKKRPRERRETDNSGAVGSSNVRRDEAEGKLLAAATKIIAKHGVDGLTLGEVGTAAGYSRGLPAHYYGNKNGLLEAVAGHIADGFANRLAQNANFAPGLDALLGSVSSYLNPKTKSPALPAVIAESLTEPALRPAVAKVDKRSIHRLASMLRTAMANGEVRSNIDPERQAILILGTLRSLVALWLVDSREISLETIRDMYVAALRRALVGR